MNLTCWQLNLQTHFGGGEVYTGFLTRAMSAIGVKTRLLVAPQATFWPSLVSPDCELLPLKNLAEMPRLISSDSGGKRGWLLTHGGLKPDVANSLVSRHLLTGMAHMPLYGRKPDALLHHHLVIPVSAYVRDSLLAHLRPDQVYPDPLYGIANLSARAVSDSPIARGTVYDWDLRKGRDRLLSWLYPSWERLQPRSLLVRRPGITLGIVSRLTPIKQFPLLFGFLAPILARHPGINLEIFGAGGYASVRDLRRALAPIGERARFWGHQSDVRSVYAQLDFLMTGLPEKEALGLNVIEAQACNLPVLGVRAAPFTETIADGRSGYLYTDPRQDQGADFERLLQRISAPDALRLQPVEASDILKKFSEEAFNSRVGVLVETISRKLSA
jgi:glycosyltransferase involved in cell wall biosynthesis